MKLLAKLCGLTMVFALSVNCFAITEDAKDPVVDFIGGAFKNWGQSEFLGLVKLGGNTATTADIGEISEQITQLTDLVEEQQHEIEQLQGDFANLINKIDQTNLRENLQHMQDNIIGISQAWVGFSNDIGTLSTFELINNSSDVIDKLKEIPSNWSMCSISKASEEISNNTQEGYFNSGLTGYVNVLTDQLNTLDGNGSLPQSLESYNNSLQIYLFKVISALQMAYSIQNTYLYLSFNNNNFKNMTFCVPGVAETGKSYEQSLESLDKYYAEHVEYILGAVIQRLISDNSDALTIKRPSTINPQKANALTWIQNDGSLTGVVGGEWQSECQLYVWDGVSSQPFIKGAFNSDLLTAKCGGVMTTINYQQLCVDSIKNGMSSYIGTDVNGKSSAALQCENYNVIAYCGSTTSHCMGYNTTPVGSGASAYYLNKTPWFSTADSHAKYYFEPKDMKTFPEAPSMSPLKLTKFEGSHGTNGFYVETAKMIFPDSSTGPQGYFDSPIQFNTKNGRKTVIFVPSSMHQSGFHYHWKISIACASGDNFCKPISENSTGLCVAGEELNLITKNSDTGYIEYTGNSCEF